MNDQQPERVTGRFCINPANVKALNMAGSEPPSQSKNKNEPGSECRSGLIFNYAKPSD